MDIKQRSTHLAAALAALLLLCCQSVLVAQDTPVFESAGPTGEVPEGSRFEVSFTLKNATAKRFIPPDFKGFRVAGGPSEMRGAGFINGKTYSNQSWSYELEAGSPGTYTIGTAAVQTSSQTLRTQPLVIRVGKARPGRSKAPATGSDDRLFVSGELERETAWLGQQVRFQIKLYTQVSVSDYDILDLPPFEGFFSQERRRFDTRTQYQTIRGKRYAVRVLYELSLFPQQAGDINIGVARVRVGIEQPGSLGTFLGSMPVVLQTQPVKLNVKPLPDPAPEGFTGAAGTYKWKVTADKDSLTTDDALTLTVAIEGNGDARRFANPRFVLPGGLEGFEPKISEQEEFETGEAFVHTRTLEYVILPRQPGDYTFMPELVFFDTDSNKYRRLQAEQPVRLRVSPGPTYGQRAVPLDTIAAVPPPAPPVISLVWDQMTAWIRSPWLWGTLGSIAVLVAFVFWRRRRATHAGVQLPVEERRARSTLKTVRARFQQVYGLVQQQDARVFYHELLKAVQGYVAIHLDLEPVLLTREDMQAKLAERGVPAPAIEALGQVWQKCEQAVFAGQAAPSDRHATWMQAEAALQQLDAALK